MVALHVTLDDLKVMPALDRAMAGADDTTALMDAIGAVLVDAARMRFTTENAPDGTSWKKSLRAEETGGKTLYDSGALYYSIVHEVAGRDAVRVGSGLPYAGIHQTGGVIRPINGKALSFQLANGEFATVAKVVMPARPYLGIDQEDAAAIEEQGRLFLAGLFGGPDGAGLGGAA